MPSFGKWVWDDTNLYEASPGDTWDDIATLAYGDPMLCSLLLHENPAYCDRVVMEGREVIVIPIIDEEKTELTPPWRR
ncbi:hypothetical protein ACH6CV_14445 [Bacillota bacterium Meth-B3]